MATTDISLNDIDAKQIRAAVNDTLFEGGSVGQWWKAQDRSFVTSVSRTIRQGLRNGQTSTQLATALRQGAFKGSRANAQTLVQTSFNAVSAEARQKTFEENSDVIKGKQQVSTLDGKTSERCIAYAGMAWELDGTPIGDALPFNGGPPRHFNCRSTLIPVMKSFEELGFNEKMELPSGTRASMDGQVPADITFDEFLKGKSVAFQNKLLGQKRAQLWRDDRITLKQLVDMRGNPLTAEQLLERAAAKRKRRLPDAATERFTTAAEWQKKFDDPSITTDEILARGKPEQRSTILGFNRRLENTKRTTHQKFYKDGKWSDERTIVHQKILDDLFEGKGVWKDNADWRAAVPTPGQKPTVTVLGGRGGSGKTFLTEGTDGKGAGAPVNLNKNLVLNSDQFKEALPEWAGWNAALLHEEASYLLKTAQRVAQQRGINVVLDITLAGGKAKIRKTLTPFIDLGYDVEAYYMHLPRQEAAFRALHRSTKPNDFRYVPTEIILESADNEITFDFVAEEFAKKWQVFDNQVPMGEFPRFLGGGGG